MSSAWKDSPSHASAGKGRRERAEERRGPDQLRCQESEHPGENRQREPDHDPRDHHGSPWRRRHRHDAIHEDRGHHRGQRPAARRARSRRRRRGTGSRRPMSRPRGTRARPDRTVLSRIAPIISPTAPSAPRFRRSRPLELRAAHDPRQPVVEGDREPAGAPDQDHGADDRDGSGVRGHLVEDGRDELAQRRQDAREERPTTRARSIGSATNRPATPASSRTPGTIANSAA